MKKIGNLTAYTFDEILNEELGEIGTPERDSFETDVKNAIQSYHLGEAIKKARLQQHITQQELGDRLGVQKAQISRIENGKNITINSLCKVLKALGVKKASLDLGSVGRVALL